MQNLAILAVILVVLAMAVRLLPQLLSSQASEQAGNDYDPSGSLLSPAEISLYGVLRQAVDEGTAIMCKVRLADIVKVKGNATPKMRATAFNKIQSKHVDFVLCDEKTMVVRRIVELDDKSHRREDRKRRDAFVDQALKSAGIPITRIEAKKAYSIPEIRERLGATVGVLQNAA